MYIRLIAISADEKEAAQILDSVLKEIQKSIINKEIRLLEPYWKIEGRYEIEANINLDFDSNFSNNRIQTFLNSISDKWIMYGSPVNEVLASQTTEGCNILKNGVSLINIFFENM
ncbi:hypothetical protein [Ruminiclostridium cellobioparum]|jgi:hypothetical protein|uniref:hypothetical protein n=1 Tax=Ruminiclostridium cellobioparum TaxID=29355 RepID=UPI0028A6E28E|nr:hypothetical protein [Ruminiclostridium cellobioparum]